MFLRTYFFHSLTALLLTFSCISTASAVQWSAGDLALAMEQAQKSGTRFDRLLASKIKEEFDNAGIKVISGSLLYDLNVDATTANLNVSKFAEPLSILMQNGLISNTAGRCEVPLPGASLINFRSESFNISAAFDPTNTVFTFDSAPGKVMLNIGIDASLNVNPIPIGFEWGGTYPEPEAYCAIRDPLFGGCLHVEIRYNWKCSKWTDWTHANVSGDIAGDFGLELSYSFAADPDPSKNRIVISNSTKLSGKLTSVPLIVVGGSNPDLSPAHTPTFPALDIFANTFNGLYPFFGSILPNNEMNYDSIEKKLTIDSVSTIGEKLDSLLKVEQARINSEFSTPIYIDIPGKTPELLKVVLDILSDRGIAIPQPFLDIIENRWAEILYYILTEDQAALVQVFAIESVCPSVAKLKIDMPATAIYAFDSSNICTVADPRGEDLGNYFADASCIESIEFQPENFQAFCQEGFTPAPSPLLGNPKLWSTLGYKNDLTQNDLISTKWTLASGTQLQIGRESLTNVNAPYVKRINFRDVGECSLEMRVYKKDINATNLKPLIFFHGGSWTLRGAAYLGAESLLAHYTDAGFAVFAPFYRMSSDGDGPTECQNASWQEITSDSEAALDWVQSFGSRFGADTTRIAVAGQSAGGHLAGWLVTHRPSEVDRALLVYPAVEVYDFIERLQQGTFGYLPDGTPYNPEAGLTTILGLLDVPEQEFVQTDLLNAPPYVLENSYAHIVEKAQSEFPPVFIMHGTSDQLLDASQSVALCNAYGGAAIEDGGGTALRAIYSCGKNSVLHLFNEADHAFEICPFPDIDGGCLAGSVESADVTVNSMQAAREWLLLDCKNNNQKCK